MSVSNASSEPAKMNDHESERFYPAVSSTHLPQANGIEKESNMANGEPKVHQVPRNIRAVKLAGLTDGVGAVLHEKRTQEIVAARSFRWLNVWANATCESSPRLSSEG